MEDNLETLNNLNQKNLELLASISPWTMIGGFIFGVIGIWLFRKGRRETNNKIVVIGIMLMMYPLFTLEPWSTWGIGAALCGAAYYWS